ncbi:hypothetical protein GEZ73_09390 [Streptococcus mitis]|uniref:Uncharacterized protein n=1 Tax=Streptococcus mitis TaxID=28037 RepID=A0A6L5H1K4_STRMT|nr:hypothetical protein [Streptococcus mitis]MQP60489.1 hypothetical protein [Streptococcus mitis]MQP69888.1 hypothetical protein [Streptococcus mitis]MQP70869.1 hypothetical protein [Streptococcus mitis]MQP87685.1 hypothetical protein [Streptococcus mitis]MQP87820.1 hypothetical protein [Streptococcus mitis]
MIFKRTKKYFIDCASLRLDSKIKIINEERKSRSSIEYYWYTGQEKRIDKKYKKLTNREISSSNSPLISLIRRGMVTSKNPYLYTPNSIEDVWNNCKLDEYGTKLGLNSSEKKKYIERNIMFKSYDEICFGDSSEHRTFTSFLSSIIILDILFESYDDNLWRIVLGYMPLNIEFEKIRLEVVDVQKVYGILFEEHYELFMTGIFRATEKVLNISTLFWEFYEERVKNDSKNINKIAFIDVYLNEFYNEILKKKIDKFINDGSYYGYKEKYIHENSTYQSLESIISIQQEMRLYQGDMESVEIRKKYGNKVWNDNVLNGLNKDNIDNVLGKYTDEYLDYEDIDVIYATYILELTEKLLHLMSSFQSFREENSHWQGNYLGYVKKYQYGNEILKYIQSGDRELLRPLIYDCLQRENNRLARERYYIKRHPDSDLAREMRKFYEELCSR